MHFTGKKVKWIFLGSFTLACTMQFSKCRVILLLSVINASSQFLIYSPKSYIILLEFIIQALIDIGNFHWFEAIRIFRLKEITKNIHFLPFTIFVRIDIMIRSLLIVARNTLSPLKRFALLVRKSLQFLLKIIIYHIILKYSTSW